MPHEESDWQLPQKNLTMSGTQKFCAAREPRRTRASCAPIGRYVRLRAGELGNHAHQGRAGAIFVFATWPVLLAQGAPWFVLMAV